jgi:hypothetical protein
MMAHSSLPFQQRDEERDMVVVGIAVVRPVSLVCVLQERCECGDGLRGYKGVVFKGLDGHIGFIL